MVEPQAILDAEAVMLWATVWGFGFASGLCRTFNHDRDGTVRNWLSGGFLAGFLAFAVVSLFLPADSQRSVFAFGVATVVGLSGKEINEVLIRRLLRKFAPELDDDENQDH